MTANGETAPVPDIGEGKRGEGGHIGYLLRQAGVTFRGRMDASLGAIGLTTPQFVALTLIGAYPALSGADLARLSLLTPQTVTVIVANLKRARLVAAEPHPEHGRIQRLTLTDAGSALLARGRPLVDALEAALVVGFDDRDMATVRRFLVATARM